MNDEVSRGHCICSSLKVIQRTLTSHRQQSSENVPQVTTKVTTLNNPTSFSLLILEEEVPFTHRNLKVHHHPHSLLNSHTGNIHRLILEFVLFSYEIVLVWHYSQLLLIYYRLQSLYSTYRLRIITVREIGRKKGRRESARVHMYETKKEMKRTIISSHKQVS